MTRRILPPAYVLNGYILIERDTKSSCYLIKLLPIDDSLPSDTWLKQDDLVLIQHNDVVDTDDGEYVHWSDIIGVYRQETK